VPGAYGVPFTVVQGGQGRTPGGEMTDDEADDLWPPATLEEADRRHEALMAKARRVTVEALSDEELHGLLFGDTTGMDAG
jgi:hypothetical protein